MDVRNLKRKDPSKIIVMDTETTGTNPSNDEILSLTIIDLNGNVLFDELINPVKRQRWPKAEEVNGISPAMVKGKKRLSEYEDEICGIWNNAELIVGYNVSFDTRFMYASGLPLKRVEEFDVMTEFAPIWGVWDEYHRDYRWPKLVQCAGHYGIDDFEAHTSLGDTEATRRCFLSLMNDPKYLKMKGADDSFLSYIKSHNKLLVGLFLFCTFGVIATLPAGNISSALIYLAVCAACGFYFYRKYQDFMRKEW